MDPAKGKKRPRTQTELPTVTHNGMTLKVGDCVLVNPDAVAEPYIAKLKKFWQKNNDPNDVDCEVTWFYRPEEAVGGRKAFHGEKELFESEHTDHIHKNTIISQCRVHTLKRYEMLPEVGDHDFFTRFKYKPTTSEFEPDRVPVYCKCEMPYNPDKMMLMCDICHEWYHTDCLRISEQAVRAYEDESRSYTCPDCDRNKRGVQQPMARLPPNVTSAHGLLPHVAW